MTKPSHSGLIYHPSLLPQTPSIVTFSNSKLPSVSFPTSWLLSAAPPTRNVAFLLLPHVLSLLHAPGSSLLTCQESDPAFAFFTAFSGAQFWPSGLLAPGLLPAGYSHSPPPPKKPLSVFPLDSLISLPGPQDIYNGYLLYELGDDTYK